MYVFMSVGHIWRSSVSEGVYQTGGIRVGVKCLERALHDCSLKFRVAAGQREIFPPCVSGSKLLWASLEGTRPQMLSFGPLRESACHAQLCREGWATLGRLLSIPWQLCGMAGAPKEGAVATRCPS